MKSPLDKPNVFIMYVYVISEKVIKLVAVVPDFLTSYFLTDKRLKVISNTTAS